MPLITNPFSRRSQVDTDDDDQGYDEDENAPRIEPPRGLVNDPDDGLDADDHGPVDDEDSQPELTASMASRVQFQEAHGKGYFFPQVDSFCDAVGRTLAYYEQHTQDLERLVNEAELKLRRQNVTLQQQAAQMSILTAAGDAVVGPDGQPLPANDRVNQLEQQLAAATEQFDELTKELAAAQQQISEQHAEVEGLHRDLRQAQAAQEAEQARAAMFESALEQARKAGVVHANTATEPVPDVDTPEPVEQSTAPDPLPEPDEAPREPDTAVDSEAEFTDDDDDFFADLGDDAVEDVEAPDDADTLTTAPQVTDGNTDSAGTTEDHAPVTPPPAAPQGGPSGTGEDETSDDPEPASSTGPSVETASPDSGPVAPKTVAEWEAAAAAEPVLEGADAPRQKEPQRVVRPGDPLDLGGLSIEDYPELNPDGAAGTQHRTD